MNTTNFNKINLDEVINIPITKDVKTLLICVARAMGFRGHTAVARSLLTKALFDYIRHMSDSDRALLERIATSTRIADNIEAVMLNELRPD